jgi:hypothetical protein
MISPRLLNASLSLWDVACLVGRVGKAAAEVGPELGTCVRRSVADGCDSGQLVATCAALVGVAHGMAWDGPTRARARAGGVEGATEVPSPKHFAGMRGEMTRGIRRGVAAGNEKKGGIGRRPSPLR